MYNFSVFLLYSLVFFALLFLLLFGCFTRILPRFLVSVFAIGLVYSPWWVLYARPRSRLSGVPVASWGRGENMCFGDFWRVFYSWFWLCACLAGMIRFPLASSIDWWYFCADWRRFQFRSSLLFNAANNEFKKLIKFFKILKFIFNK